MGLKIYFKLLLHLTKIKITFNKKNKMRLKKQEILDVGFKYVNKTMPYLEFRYNAETKEIQHYNDLSKIRSRIYLFKDSENFNFYQSHYYLVNEKR